MGVSPRLGKRQIIQQRKSRTIVVRDDSETIKPKQRPVKVSDAFKVCYNHNQMQSQGRDCELECSDVVFSLFRIFLL